MDDLGFVPDDAQSAAPPSAADSVQSPAPAQDDGLGFVPEDQSAQSKPAASQQDDGLGFIPDSADPEKSGLGNALSALGATDEGILRGVLGPVAPYAETLFGQAYGIPGTSITEQEQRKKEHETAANAGEWAGLGGSMLTGTGEIAAIESAVKPLIYGTAEKAAQVAAESSRLLNLGKGALNLGIQSGLFHTGDNLTKMVLGETDPNEPVSSLLAGTGAATLLGGALGVGSSAAGEGLQAIANSKMGQAAGQWLAEFGSRFDMIKKYGGMEGITYAAADQLTHLYNTVKAAAEGGFGLKQSSIDKLTANVAPEQVAGHVQAVSDMLNKIPDALKKGGAIDESISDWRNKVFPGNGAFPTAADVFKATDELKKEVQAVAGYGKRDPDVFKRRLFSAARDLQGKLIDSLEDQKTWGEMGNFQKNLNAAYSSVIDPIADFESAATTATKENGKVVDPGKLHNIFRQLGRGKLTADVRSDKISGLFEPAKNLIDTVNGLHAAQGLEANIPPTATGMLDEMLNKAPPKGAKAASWAFDAGQSWLGSALSHIGGTIVGSAVGHSYLGYRAGEAMYPFMKETAKKPSGWAISTALKALTAGEYSEIPQAANYVKGIQRGADKISGAVDNLFKVGGKQYMNSEYSEKDREKLKKFVESDDLSQQLQNQAKPPVAKPDQEEQKFAEGGAVMAPQPSTPDVPAAAPAGNVTGGMGKIAAIFPEQSMLLGAAKGRINGYLNQIRPHNEQPKMPFDDVTPNHEHHKSYTRALNIANHPLSILDHVKAGTLEPEHMQHMNSMYPELTNHLRTKLAARVVEAQQKNEKPPYHVRQGLSLFMGSPLDSNLTPANIQAAQATFVVQKAMNQQVADGRGLGKAKGDKLTDMSKQYMTSQQASLDRKNRPKV